MIEITRENAQKLVTFTEIYRDDNKTYLKTSLRKDVFVALWQTSTCMDEFMSRCHKINDCLSDHHNPLFEVYQQSFKLPRKASTYGKLAQKYRRNGVALKRLRHINTVKKSPGWAELANLAAKLS